MTIEEAKSFLIDISYKLGNMSVEYLTEKDGEKMREAVKVLEQEPCDDELDFIQPHKKIRVSLSSQPKMGYWIDDTKYGGTECSECGKWYPHATIAKNEIKYCSECGARMVEPQEREDKG